MAVDVHQEVFIQEAQELLQELESSLLELEENSGDIELVARVFRAMHTIKGSGAMFGFENIAHLVHDIETAYDKVRNGELKVSKAMLEYSLKSCDIIKEMLEDPEIKADSALATEILSFFRGLQQTADPGKNKASKEKNKQKTPEPSEIRTFRIRFRPSEDILLQGTDPELLLMELEGMGEAKIVAHTTSIPSALKMNPEKCYTLWDIILTTTKTEDDIKDVFIFVEDDSEITITEIEDFDGDRDNYKKLGEILLEKGDITPEVLNKLLSERKMLGEMLVESGIVAHETIEAALAEQKTVKDIRAKKNATENNSTLRVPSEKLDILVDLVGELVTVQARLNQTAVQDMNPDLLKIAEEVERLVWELRDNTMSIRMLPIGSTFNKYKRLVRDLSKELGKDIELVTKGEDTELDKTVIEKLGDPLVHLIRNSLDHGIETPVERAAAGKKDKGQILLSAVHSGDSVLIEIKDNGKGIRRDIVYNKAIEKGIIPEGAELTDKEVWELIFAPGFSTAVSVSNVSGRGVGMDVVRRNIEELRGTIDIDSIQGEGTTITLKLPLTLAIIDGLLVSIGEQFFIIPLSIVKECIEFSEGVTHRKSGRKIIKVRDDLVPYVKMRDIFGIREAEPAIQQIVIVELEERKVGFLVDNVVGDHQTVIKSLGKAFKGVECISGASILGDGSVALIIDIAKIYTSIE
ncbi:CheA signal transduction histidine kinase [Denitrovibrio acetiphilus DSM 12809]|uniref:Chemotaxis protein CheA n=1 Tax=Denitrovibrio acetiphilus (strain DSM 12809 / NBRC 114555 / N2460) TaxID=522772 RepID=D4H205_DENA2|nr:chemotaxis protein CheA [Denitrovibrio acetiphilus]ADD66982.1 CheA signal transduction histidine kinase [Denitrovibrio acetiphilus DSM 12809]